MKRITLAAVIVIMASFFITSCTEKVEENGLTADINAIVPDSILASMEIQGLPINGGNKPPELEGTFVASPFDLVSSTVPEDPEFHTFSDFIITFTNFDKRDLTVEIDYDNGPETGVGLGSFVVGEDDEFSVFCEINSTQLFVFKATAIMVISGTLVEGGIQDFYVANFMIDNNGNEAEVWIENGTGRVIYDSDGFSEQTSEAKSQANNNKTSSLSRVK